MTSEHIRQMREMRAEKNKLEAERDHWMNEAIDLRRDLESIKQSDTETIELVRKIAVHMRDEYLSIDNHGFTLAHGLLKGRLKHYLERLDKVLK